MNLTTRRFLAHVTVGLAIGVMICSAVHAAPSMQFGPVYPKGPAQPDKAKLTDGVVVVDCIIKVVDTKGGVQPVCDLQPFGMWLGAKVFGVHACNSAGCAKPFGASLTGTRTYYMQNKTLSGKPVRQAVMSDILTHYTADPAPANPPALPGATPPPTTPTEPTTPTTPPAAATWVPLVSEWQSFDRGQAVVRYGVAGNWREVSVSGYTMCSADGLGLAGFDPAPTSTKSCEIRQ